MGLSENFAVFGSTLIPSLQDKTGSVFGEGRSSVMRKGFSAAGTSPFDSISPNLPEGFYLEKKDLAGDSTRGGDLAPAAAAALTVLSVFKSYSWLICLICRCTHLQFHCSLK